MTGKQRFWRDPLLYPALGAAIVFWAGLYLVVQPSIDPTWPLGDPLRFATAAVLYPVVEELVFRGFVQELAHRHLKAWRIGPLSHANILTSLAFTVLHFVNHPPMWAAAVFIPSLVFGYFKDRTQGLGAPVTLHVFYNSGYFWLFMP